MASQLLDPNRLFPADGRARAIAQHLYQDIKDLPIISPHGHTDPQWYAENNYFPDAAELFLMPDHYIFRILKNSPSFLLQSGVGVYKNSTRVTLCHLAMVGYLIYYTGYSC